MALFDFLSRPPKVEEPQRAPWEVAMRGERMERKAAYDLMPMGIQGRPQYPDTDIPKLQEAYQRNEIVFACIDARATAATDPRLIVQDRKAGEWVESVGHPLRRLMMRPNPIMDEAGFTQAALVSLDIAGVFYCEIVRSPGGAPAELWPLNPAKMFPIPGPGNTIPEYEFRDGMNKVRIKAEDMLVRYNYHPASRYQGLSRLAVCLGTVDADSAQTDYVRAFFNNSGIPSGVLKVKGTYTQEQADTLRAKWRERLGRLWGRQHDIAVLDDNADYQQLGTNLDQLDSEIMRSVSESRICMVFGVPPLVIYAYVGLLRSTYSNLGEAWRGFWESTLNSMFKRHASWLQWALLPQFENPERVLSEQVRLSYDLSDVVPLADNVNEKQTRARANFAEGGITLNEFRADIGEKPDPAGDYYLRKIVMVATPAGTDIAVLPPSPAPTPGKAALGPQAAKALRNNRIESLAAHVASTNEKYLMGQYERAARAVEA